MPRARDISLVREPGPNPAGRVCAEPSCPTILHRYHDGDRCYVHAEPEGEEHADVLRGMAELMQEAA